MVGCGAARDGRKSPAKLLERAPLGVELWAVRLTALEFLELVGKSLDLPNELDEFTSLPAWLERSVAGGGHR